MSRITPTETKWEQRWHDSTIEAIDSVLKSFRREISVETSKGTAHGADLVIRTNNSAREVINIEVQMHPSGSSFKATMDRWAARHAGALATFIVCPTALVATLTKRVEKHPLGEKEHVYVFGDNSLYLTLLCSCVFAMIQRRPAST